MQKMILCVAVLASLSACGNRQEDGGGIMNGLLARAKTVFQSKDTAVSPAPPIVFTREALTKTDAPVILVNVPSRKAQASLGMIRKNGAVQTYMSADGISLVFERGILIGTRGFGDDLMSSNHTQLRANLRQGSGIHTRVLRHLDTLDRLQATTLKCSITSQGPQSVAVLGETRMAQQMLEACAQDGGISFNNLYWMSKGGIWKSAQWVSPSVGPMIIDQVQ